MTNAKRAEKTRLDLENNYPKAVVDKYWSVLDKRLHGKPLTEEEGSK